ncbi:MAG: SMC family ATPase, partial [Anaerolineales bacterium]|nr:SMC family ATPase [Anaerolineales bacterium]
EILSELEEEQERNARLLSLEKELTQAHEAWMNGETQLADIQSIHASLNDQARLLNTLSNQIDKAGIMVAQTQEKLALREKEREGFQEILSQSSSINQEYSDWKKAQKALSDWEKTAEKFREQEIRRQEPLLQIAAENARLKQEQESLEDSHQELLGTLEELSPLSNELVELKEKIERTEIDIGIRDQKKIELEHAREQQAEAKAENPRLYEEMKELENRINELKETAGSLCPLCGQELSPEDRKSLILTLEAEGKEFGDRYRDNKALLTEADQVVKDLQLQITEYSLAENKLRNLNQHSDRVENRIAHVNSQKQSWESNNSKTLEDIKQILENEAYAAKARKLLSEINGELKEIGYDAAEHDQVRKLVNQGTVIQDRKGALDSAKAALKPLEREIKELTALLISEQKDLKKQTADLTRSRQELEAAMDQAPDTRQSEKTLLELKEKENILQREVGAAQQKVSVLENQKLRKYELEQKRQEISNRVKQFKQLEAAFGKDGVPALLIEQALPNIEAKANQILERLSSGTMSIRFLTQRSYKDLNREDLMETLDIQIRDQAGVRDYEMYSGGESFRINFAIRLALSHVLAQRAGAKLQTLVIDEGFGSQDSLGRQRLIEAINLIKGDFKKILVISHIEQIKEAFSTQLLVEKTPQGSQVTLV